MTPTPMDAAALVTGASGLLTDTGLLPIVFAAAIIGGFALLLRKAKSAAK